MKQSGMMILLTLALIHPITARGEDPHAHHHDPAVELKMSLNDGQKWMADRHTFDSAAWMRASVTNFQKNASAGSLDAIHKVGQQLEKQLHELIRGCTMIGPHHDQLHIWIAMLAPQIEALIDATDVTAGQAAVAKVSDLLKVFDDHFRLDDAAEVEMDAHGHSHD